MDISGQAIRDIVARVKHPLGPTTAPRAAWMVFKRLPLPGVGLLARGLGRLAPIANLGFAVADIWIALDDWILIRRQDDFEQIFKALMSSLTASFSIIAALNVPLLSHFSALLAVVSDLIKHTLIELAAEDEYFSLPLISNPTAGGRLEMTPAAPMVMP